jgi:hypothetical protein
MKKLITIVVFLIVGNLASAQSYYYKDTHKRDFTFQVAPTYFNYNGDLYGYQLGINYKEVINISYFHTRSYQFGENWMDDRFAGIQTSVVFPVCDKVQIGPSVRIATYNEEWQKVFIGVETRVDVSDVLKFALEYGAGDQKGFGLKLIWNMY